MQALNHVVDLFRAVLGAAGQIAHFVSNNRKATTRVPCPCGLDRRVQCQQVGLFSNPLNYLENRGNVGNVLAEFIDDFRSGVNLF